jgi:hypothetical protein
MAAPHGNNRLGNAAIISDCDLDRHITLSQNTREHHRGNTQGSQRFFGLHHIHNQLFHIRPHTALRAVIDKGAQVSGSAKTSGENQGIDISRPEPVKRDDVTARDPGRFSQHVAPLTPADLFRDMVNNLCLIRIRRSTHNLSADPVKMQHSQNRLMNFGTILNPAP